MQRRDFLGTVIGLYLADRSPFLAIPAPRPRRTTRPEPDWLGTADTDDLMGVVGQYRTPGGIILSAPIEEVVGGGGPDGERTLCFLLKPWECVHEGGLIVRQLRLVRPDGRLLRDWTAFSSGPTTLNPGDTLKGSYTTAVHDGQ